MLSDRTDAVWSTSAVVDATDDPLGAAIEASTEARTLIAAAVQIAP